MCLRWVKLRKQIEVRMVGNTHWRPLNLSVPLVRDGTEASLFMHDLTLSYCHAITTCVISSRAPLALLFICSLFHDIDT